MTGKPSPPPDLVLRFTPTPYVFECDAGRDLIRIESDDLQTALFLRHSCSLLEIDEGEPVVFWRLIRERRAPRYGVELSVLSSGKIKTLLHGSGTILIADLEKREVFGFVGSGLQLPQLAEKLLPLLIRSHGEHSRDAFTNK
jgi:hypothetical protein